MSESRTPKPLFVRADLSASTVALTMSFTFVTDTAQAVTASGRKFIVTQAGNVHAGSSGAPKAQARLGLSASPVAAQYGLTLLNAVQDSGAAGLAFAEYIASPSSTLTASVFAAGSATAGDPCRWIYVWEIDFAAYGAVTFTPAWSPNSLSNAVLSARSTTVQVLA